MSFNPLASIYSIKPVRKQHKPRFSRPHTAFPSSSSFSKGISQKNLNTETEKPKTARPVEHQHDKKMEVDDNVVIIHVHDSARSSSKNFYCQRDLLLKKMLYFESYLEGRNTRDVDISVHCDIEVFEWLMNSIKPENDCEFEIKNVVSILISADFLQMNDLVLQAIEFLIENFNSVVKMPLDLSCINNSLVEKIASKFDPFDILRVSDKKDRILTKVLLAKLALICDEHHFCSCLDCGSLIILEHKDLLFCTGAKIEIGFRGESVSRHNFDESFIVTTYVYGLLKQGIALKEIYRHFLACTVLLECEECGMNFNGTQFGFCQYHPGTITKLTDTPRYSCCQCLAVFKGQDGCSFKKHKCKEDGMSRDMLDIIESCAISLSDARSLQRLRSESLLSSDSTESISSTSSRKRKKKKRSNSQPNITLRQLQDEQRLVERTDMTRMFRRLSATSAK
ncbi:hypothetical protein PCE1_001130 [Barthelona sp. PCE]